MNPLKNHIKTSPEVSRALRNNLPVVALESTIIAHGMPFPDNLTFATQAESIVRESGAVPATIAILNGVVNVGLNGRDLETLAKFKHKTEKIALRDIGYTIAKELTGATTVSATMHIAHLAGIKVFATGGIGGVHRNTAQDFDISQDLLALSQIPIIVVSAGCKAILDIPKTLEMLEMLAVPVIGYKTFEFPAFYSRKSGYKTVSRCDTPVEIVKIYRAQATIGINSGLLVANPVPKESEIPKSKIETVINKALAECEKGNITGKNITPFLLSKIVKLSAGKSLEANIALALNNVRLAASIAKAL